MIQNRLQLRARYKRLPRYVRVLAVFLCIVVLFPVLFIFLPLGVLTLACSPAPITTFDDASVVQLRQTLGTYTPDTEGDVRSEDRTYLTVPEWYIVYSAEEYAAFVPEHAPSHFPYFRAIGQQWRVNCHTYSALRGKQYPFNMGDHIAIAVIDTSYTLEYLLKGLYETTLGRMAEAVAGANSEEDIFDAKVSKQYAAFLHGTPFYDFPYFTHLRELWTDVPLWGLHPLRKWERRVFLSAEYSAKGTFGAVMGYLTHSSYGVAAETTELRVTNVDANALKVDDRIRVIGQLRPTTFVIQVPRYEPFKDIVMKLAQKNAQIIDVMGNTEILFTALVPASQNYEGEGQLMFSEPILTDPTKKRIAVRVPVFSLIKVLKDFEQKQMTMEHLYDY